MTTNTLDQLTDVNAVGQLVLPSGELVLVDAADLPLLETFNWYIRRDGRQLYAQATVAMHRLLLDLPSDLHVDHINGNGLDNRRANLRAATQSQNVANGGPRSTNRSGYKGVSAKRDKWYAAIRIDGRQHSLGRFDDPWDAAQAYNAAALAVWGEFAWLNQRVGS